MISFPIICTICCPTHSVKPSNKSTFFCISSPRNYVTRFDDSLYLCAKSLLSACHFSSYCLSVNTGPMIFPSQSGQYQRNGLALFRTSLVVLLIPAYSQWCHVLQATKECPSSVCATAKCRCRSTPARHAASLYQLKRHPNAQERLKQYKHLIKLQIFL